MAAVELCTISYYTLKHSLQMSLAVPFLQGGLSGVVFTELPMKLPQVVLRQFLCGCFVAAWD